MNHDKMTNISAKEDFYGHPLKYIPEFPDLQIMDLLEPA